MRNGIANTKCQFAYFVLESKGFRVLIGGLEKLTRGSMTQSSDPNLLLGYHMIGFQLDGKLNIELRRE